MVETPYRSSRFGARRGGDLVMLRQAAPRFGIEVAALTSVTLDGERVSSTRYVGPHSFTYIYAGANDLDRAFEWQAKAYEDGASPFFYFAPLIDNLQADPRHSAELRRVGWNRNLPGDRA